METIPLRIAYTAYKRRQQAKQELPIACNALIVNDGEQAVAQSAFLQPVEPRAIVNNDFGGFEKDLPPSYDFAAGEKADNMDVKDVKDQSMAMVRQFSDSASSGSGSGAASGAESDSDTVLTLYHPDPSEESVIPPVIRADPFGHPIAILPQYMTRRPTTLTITELGFPNLGSNFAITSSETGSDEPILHIHRERPSRTHRQIIYDGRTGATLLQVRLLRVQFPKSFFISDPEDTRVAEIQGNFSAPGTGHRTTVLFTNACDGQPCHLFVKSAWRNRRAEIRTVSPGKKASSKDDDASEVLACMSSEWFNVRNMLGGRRSYEVQVAAGVDVTLIVALITALDQRA